MPGSASGCGRLAAIGGARPIFADTRYNLNTKSLQTAAAVAGWRWGENYITLPCRNIRYSPAECSIYWISFINTA
jgi:hypothetical protein